MGSGWKDAFKKWLIQIFTQKSLLPVGFSCFKPNLIQYNLKKYCGIIYIKKKNYNNFMDYLYFKLS